MMKKMMALVLMTALLLSGCIARPSQTEPTQPENTVQTEPTAPEQQTTASGDGLPEGPSPDATVPDSVVTPDEMPQPPEADAEIPPQPSMDLETQ